MTVDTPSRTRTAAVDALVHATCLGMSTGFYLWIVNGPKSADVAIVKTTQPNLLAGLSSALAITFAGGFVVAATLGLSEKTRIWHKRLALGSCALYLSTTSAVLGPIAVRLALATAIVWVLVLALRQEEPHSTSALVTLHTAMLGTALAFFHQWAWYLAGWEALVGSVSAITKLLFGG